MLVLGIESSCDETAAAIVRDGREVLSSVIHSQIASHRPYGGVVPEIASREHVGNFPVVTAEGREAGGNRMGRPGRHCRYARPRTGQLAADRPVGGPGPWPGAEPPRCGA